jgi:p-hydroxybenzoate 3-monooxygenase
MRTQVAIIGGGPSGLMLSQLLHLKGIDTIVLERQSREYVLSPHPRRRAGAWFAELMREAQCGERMDREGEIHEGFFIADNGRCAAWTCTNTAAAARWWSTARPS